MGKAKIKKQVWLGCELSPGAKYASICIKVFKNQDLSIELSYFDRSVCWRCPIASTAAIVS